MSTVKKDPKLSATAVKSRGWTDSMIRDFLGPPDATAKSTYGASAPRTLLYLAARVEKRQQQAEKRRQAALNAIKSAAAKYEESLEEAHNDFPISPDPPCSAPQAAPLQWDDFQIEAMDYVDQHRSVLVCAPTGSGKTAIAEYAVTQALAEARSAIYTTPVKALSNQKYRDFSAELGSDKVGLLTGDVTINPAAEVVVMTTEVLRNMLYAPGGSQRLQNVSWVVLDEVHYLQDKSRGPVWEEIIINAPAHMKFVCLSATISNTEEFVGWLRERRGEVGIVRTQKRPVPLTHWHTVDDGRRSGLAVLELLGQDPKTSEQWEDYFADNFLDPSHGGDQDWEYDPVSDRLYLPYNYEWRFSTPSATQIIELLKEHNQLPALYFIFSRDGCDNALAHLYGSRHSLPLTTDEEKEKIRKIAGGVISVLNKQDRADSDADLWLDKLVCGVAAHHAGMLPVFKEAVEQCFCEGLIKVVFATETMALGINMPARTVVLDKLSKWNGEEHSMLTPMNYSQIAGRAGRRGIDSKGHVISLWSPYVELHSATSLAANTNYRLLSSFSLNYHMVSNLIRSYDEQTALGIWRNSFAEYQGRMRHKKAATVLSGLQDEAGTLRSSVDPQVESYVKIEKEITKVKRRKERGSVSIKDVVSINGAFPRAVVKTTRSKNGTRFWSVGSTGDITKHQPPYKRATIKTIGTLKKDTTVKDIPAAKLKSKTYKPSHYAEVSAELTNSSWDPNPRNVSAAKTLEDLNTALKNHPLHNSPELGPKKAEFARTTTALARTQEKEEDARLRFRHHEVIKLGRNFDDILNILGKLKYTDGWALTDKGELLAELHSSQALLLAECLTSGCLEGLDDADLTGVLSTMINDRRVPAKDSSPAYIKQCAKNSPAAIEALTEVHKIYSSILAMEKGRLSITAEIDFGCYVAAHKWAQGGPLYEAISTDPNITAGDFCRNMMMLADVTRQIANAAPSEQLRSQARRLTGHLLRGTVGASATIKPNT